MKKLIISSVLGVFVAAMSALGQGYAVFTTSPHYTWDDTLSTGPSFNANFMVALYWAPNGDNPAVAGLMSTTPTNNNTAGSSQNFQPFSYATAWSDITSDPNFVIASSNSAPWLAIGNANGSATADGGNEFDIVGTTALTTYAMYMVAWNTQGGTLLTPAAAAGAGAPLGWTSVFAYTVQAAPPLGAAPASPVINRFGVGYFPVPEPTTLALAGLGGLSMLFLRRRKA